MEPLGEKRRAQTLSSPQYLGYLLCFKHPLSMHDAWIQRLDRTVFVEGIWGFQEFPDTCRIRGGFPPCLLCPLALLIGEAKGPLFLTVL